MHAYHFQTPQSARQTPVQIQFTANIWQEGDWFVAQCTEFEVSSQGRTEKEALDNLREAFYLKAGRLRPSPSRSPLSQTSKCAKGKRHKTASLKKKTGISETYGNDIETGYREMANDEVREAEASEWAEITIGDLADESR